MCNLKAGTTDTLQFQFTDIAASSEGFASLRMNFTNFFTPFSSQTFKDIIKVYTYQDAACTQRDPYSRTITVQSVTIKPRNMPSSSVQVSTSNKVIAYQGADNALSMTFKPESQMAPSGRGKIKIYMPYWYQIGSSNVMPYNPRAFNKCTSTCFTTESSSLQG